MRFTRMVPKSSSTRTSTNCALQLCAENASGRLMSFRLRTILSRSLCDISSGKVPPVTVRLSAGASVASCASETASPLRRVCCTASPFSVS